MKLDLKQIRHRGEWLVVHAVANFVPLLPRNVCQLIATALGTLASFLDSPGRNVALDNLEAAFGSAYSLRDRKKIVRESYRHFARAAADLFWSPSLTGEKINEVVDVSEVDAYIANGGGDRAVIFAGPHYGGYELVSIALGHRGLRSTAVSAAFKNPLLNKTFDRVREQTGNQMIRRERAIVRMYKALENGRNVLLLADLTISAKLPSVPITCFGMQSCVTLAHAWLQERTGADIVPMHAEPTSDGRQKIVIHPRLEIAPGATHAQVAQACWDVFEPIIRANPAPWLWMYKHWRYRPADADRPYPPYANESSAFEQLLAATTAHNSPAPPASEERVG